MMERDFSAVISSLGQRLVDANRFTYHAKGRYHRPFFSSGIGPFGIPDDITGWYQDHAVFNNLVRSDILITAEQIDLLNSQAEDVRNLVFRHGKPVTNLPIFYKAFVQGGFITEEQAKKRFIVQGSGWRAQADLDEFANPVGQSSSHFLEVYLSIPDPKANTHFTILEKGGLFQIGMAILKTEPPLDYDILNPVEDMTDDEFRIGIYVMTEVGKRIKGESL